VAGDSINLINRQEYVSRLVRNSWKSLGGILTGTAAEGPAPTRWYAAADASKSHAAPGFVQRLILAPLRQFIR
jgi:hypothetical protein